MEEGVSPFGGTCGPTIGVCKSIWAQDPGRGDVGGSGLSVVGREKVTAYLSRKFSPYVA